MPTLKFLLSNRRFSFEADKEMEYRRLFFDAKVERPSRGGIFTVSHGEKRYNGFCMKGYALISQTTPKSELPPSSALGPKEMALTNCIVYSPEYKDEWTGKEYQPHLEIRIALPSDAFHNLLQTDMETCLVSLSFTSDVGKGGLIFGYAPDGSDSKWTVDVENPVPAESICLTIASRPNEVPEPEPISKTESQEPTPVAPVVVDTSELARSINRLIWIITLIGILVVLKVYL